MKLSHEFGFSDVLTESEWAILASGLPPWTAPAWTVAQAVDWCISKIPTGASVDAMVQVLRNRQRITKDQICTVRAACHHYHCFGEIGNVN